MNCTGCETKLNRTLGSFPGVSNLKTSLVMSRAEFGLDPAAASVADVMRHIERTTEFKCEKISTEGASIDVLSPGDQQAWLRQPLPLGVEGFESLDKNTVRISFDPKVIGARDLVEKAFPQPLRLAPLRGDAGLHAGSTHVRHVGYMTVLSAVLTTPVLVLAWAPLDDRPITYGAVSLALATVVQVAIAGPFYPKALKSLVFSRMIEMDLLIVLSTSAAYVFSVVSFGYLVRGAPLSTGEFFETSTLLVTLIMVGRYVSALARQKAVESISIRSLQQASATLVSDAGADERDIDTRLLQYGDVFKIRPDTRAPTDGVVVTGASEADESMLTGESRPIEKQPGSSIIAGSINGPGTLVVRLTRLPGENTISAIAGMVDGAKLSKPKIQDLADRVASYFVPGVVSLTVVVFVVWIAVGILRQNLTGSEAAVQATTYAITVLIVSCPCAIGLAVPMVIVIASGVAAQRGIVFKSANGIEIAHKATHVVLDKTGTITEGRLAVVAEEALAGDPEATASMILGLVTGIKHPVSAAVAAHLTAKGVSPARVEDVQSLVGQGVAGRVGTASIRAGNMRWLGLEGHPQAQAVAARGCTVFGVTVDARPVAVYGLADTIRPEAAAVLAALGARGIDVTLLSGDDDGAVAAVAQTLGLPTSRVRARCSPADKAAHVRQLSSTAGKTAPVVLFVGDGTNDAPALAQAALGIHLAPSSSANGGGGGADVAASAADVVLLGPSLCGVLGALDVSRAAVRRIAFNFAWSFVYNVLAVLLAAGAFVSTGSDGGAAVRIPPEYAGLGELVSVLPVIVAAVAMRWARI